MSTRVPDKRELSHEELGERFATALSDYDTSRRLEVLTRDFLSDDRVVGKKALDVGCGLGFFTEALHQRGAEVTGCDLGPSLVEKTAKRSGCPAVVADALNLTEQFGEANFDLVVSSECIEHTPEPARAVEQMLAVLKPGGFLALSTPNIGWYPVVRLASALRLRPFDGYENFSSWRGLRREIGKSANVLEERGLHLFPFQLGCHGLSQWCDRHLQWARGVMINLCFLAQKR